MAPDGQRSAMSHRITLHETIEFLSVDFPVEGVHAYASTGTPADCVRFGILNIVKEKSDYVFPVSIMAITAEQIFSIQRP